MVTKTKLSAEDYLSRIELQEDEYEKEIRFLIKKYHGLIQKEKAETRNLKVESNKLNKEKLAMNQKDEEKQKKIEQLIIENTLLMEKKVSLCLSLLKMQEQLLEREQAILNKEKAIQNSMDTEKALENYRSILREKIIWLKRNKDQIVRDTLKKEDSLARMFQELVSENKLNEDFIAQYHRLLAKKVQLLNSVKDIQKKDALLNKKRQLIHDRLDHLLSKSEGSQKENRKSLENDTVINSVGFWFFGDDAIVIVFGCNS